MNSEKPIFSFSECAKKSQSDTGKNQCSAFWTLSNQILANFTSHNLFWYETGIAVAKKVTKLIKDIEYKQPYTHRGKIQKKSNYLVYTTLVSLACYLSRGKKEKSLNSASNKKNWCGQQKYSDGWYPHFSVCMMKKKENEMIHKSNSLK